MGFRRRVLGVRIALKALVRGDGLDELGVGAILLGEEFSELRDRCPQDRVRNAGAAEFAAPDGFEEPERILGRDRHECVSLVQLVRGFDHLSRGSVQRIAGAMRGVEHADV
ncbi:hypothetical protein PV749_01760 [Streptomyces sp. ID03-2B]|uniref:Uncharacterized protein n=1 Tax=Streptomyces caviscabies TaxID=90079 RepID=A0ABW2MNT0_9ACTN|nr:MULTISPECIES: hypothetical protein [unclassified Streptomyces]MCL6289166.1 hypothetical protein [Streptomyces sp. 43Y-GA-1]MDX3339014.1 hypothetical protein [Streptomyces sp. ME02-6979.5a]MDX3506381.1 hypothetical protein [Streptomyces sp. ATCC51928]MDX3589858.1 hypothetical protein [Streptomyces sp. ID03-2B]MDX5522228.1 hypothetical protein [Streptomyces sp. DE06-01C]